MPWLPLTVDAGAERREHPHLTAMLFREFWPLYLSLHSHPANRALHAGGTVAALGLLAFAAARRKVWPVPLALAVGYGAAWLGHGMFERNRPASFGHPLLSLAADLAMVVWLATGHRVGDTPAGRWRHRRGDPK